MKQLLLLAALSTLITGCASLKGNVSVEHKSDVIADAKAATDKKYDSLNAANQNLNEQVNQLKQLQIDKNIQTKTTSEKTLIDLRGSNTSAGAKGNSALKSISQVVHRGRIKATATYFYANDSIHLDLRVKDTLIAVNKTTTETTDNSKIQSSSDTHNSTVSNTANATTVSSASANTSDASVHRKTDTKVKASFAASIGISNWIPVIIAFVLGLFLGKLLFGIRIKK